MADQGEPRPAHRPPGDVANQRPPRADGGTDGGTAWSATGASGAGAAFEAGGRFPRRPAFAALDLGTNNCRLLVARPDGQDFAIVDAFSRIVRLGEGMTETGRIGEAAITRAIDALSVCAEKLRRRRVLLSRAVATEACRRAANGMEFIARVRADTGIALDIISPQEEARLAVMGCHQLLAEGRGPALIFDIGGGSTELVLIDDRGGEPNILAWQSVPWGVVSLTEALRHDTNDAAARAAAYAAMRERVRESVRAFAARVDQRWPNRRVEELRLLGTSGTVTTLASLYLDLPSYDRSRVDGLSVATADMVEMCRRLSDMAISEREALACVGRERADLVVAGCALLEEIIDIWPAVSLNVADRGIREGVLRQLMFAHANAERGSRRRRGRL